MSKAQQALSVCLGLFAFFLCCKGSHAFGIPEVDHKLSLEDSALAGWTTDEPLILESDAEVLDEIDFTIGDFVMQDDNSVRIPLYPRGPLAKRTVGLVELGINATQAERDALYKPTSRKPLTFYGYIKLGTPPQKLTVVFDTGSSDTWVQGAPCPSCGGHPAFDSNASTSFIPNCIGLHNCTFVDVYGSGRTSGVVAIDTLQIGRILISDTYQFGMVTAESGSISRLVDSSGMVGLAFYSLSRYSTPSIAALLETFAFYLDNGGNSFVDLGAVNSSMVQPDDVWRTFPVLTVNSQYVYWTIYIPEMKIGGATLCDSDAQCHAIIDTGTNLLAAPSSFFEKDGLKELEKFGCTLKFGIAYVCPSNKTLPNLEISLGDSRGFPIKFILKPEDYAHPLDDGSVEVGIIRNPLTSSPLWVLGQSFLNKRYVVFDAEEKEIRIPCNPSVCIEGNTAVEFPKDYVSLGSATANGQITFAVTVFAISFLVFSLVVCIYTTFIDDKRRKTVAPAAGFSLQRRPGGDDSGPHQFPPPPIDTRTDAERAETHTKVATEAWPESKEEDYARGAKRRASVKAKYGANVSSDLQTPLLGDDKA